MQTLDQTGGKDGFPQTVAIVGIGMLGGSLGLALKAMPTPPRVLGWARRAESVREALELGMIDDGSTDAAEVLPRADLTVLCLPVVRCIEFAVKNAELWRAGAAVTDVGSTKRDLVRELTPVLAETGAAFVGSHPMAGSEKSGLAHARAELYRRAVVFVTPEEGTPAAAVRLVTEFWARLGALPHTIPPARHDALVARTSHALHIAAAAAARAVLRDPEAVYGTAGGFRDFTRIASSSTDMWAEICQANRDEILTALNELEAEIAVARRALEAGDDAAVADFLRTGSERRNRWLAEWRRLKGEAP
jgi:prephenate dehydrogenase